MKRVKKLVVLLGSFVIVGCVLYAASWLAAHIFLKRYVEQFQPLWQIEYDAVQINVLGSVKLSNVSIMQSGSMAGITLGEVELSSSSLLFLVMAQRRMQEGRWPDDLALTLKDVEIDLAMPAIRLLAFLTQLRQQQLHPGLSSCDFVGYAHLSLLESMGIQQVNLESALTFKQPEPQHFVLETWVSVDDLADVALMLTLRSDHLTPTWAGLSATFIDQGVLHIQDKGLLENWLGYCSQQRQISVADVITLNLRRLDDYLEHNGQNIFQPVDEQTRAALFQPEVEILLRLQLWPESLAALWSKGLSSAWVKDATLMVNEQR